MIFINQPVEVEIQCIVDGVPMSGVTDAVIEYKKPDSTIGEWPATVTGDKVSYKTSPTEIDDAGMWRMQPIVTLSSGDQVPGTTVSMPVRRRFA
jgi:hypothetical protein